MSKKIAKVILRDGADYKTQNSFSTVAAISVMAEMTGRLSFSPQSVSSDPSRQSWSASHTQSIGIHCSFDAQANSPSRHDCLSVQHVNSSNRFNSKTNTVHEYPLNVYVIGFLPFDRQDE